MKPKMLFLDDRTKRIHSALEKYSRDYCLTIVTNAKECLRQLSAEDFAEVHLDCDLNGDDFVDLDSENSVMEVIRYIQRTGWVRNKRKPHFVIHSSNQFAACAVKEALEYMELYAIWDRFSYCEKKYKVGIVAGMFDILHPGYIRMFEEAKTHCEYLIVALHEENIGKPPAVFTVEDRQKTLMALRWVDEVKVYKTEEQLDELLILLEPDVRFLGGDYVDGGKKITGKERCPIVYLSRDHTFSSSAVRKSIMEAGCAS